MKGETACLYTRVIFISSWYNTVNDDYCVRLIMNPWWRAREPVCTDTLYADHHPSVVQVGLLLHLGNDARSGNSQHDLYEKCDSFQGLSWFLVIIVILVVWLNISTVKNFSETLTLTDFVILIIVTFVYIYHFIIFILYPPVGGNIRSRNVIYDCWVIFW